MSPVRRTAAAGGRQPSPHLAAGSGGVERSGAGLLHCAGVRRQRAGSVPEIPAPSAATAGNDRLPSAQGVVMSLSLDLAPR